MLVFYEMTYECELAVYAESPYLDPEIENRHRYLTETDIREGELEPGWQDKALAIIDAAFQNGTALPATIFWATHVIAAALNAVATKNPIISSPRWEPALTIRFEDISFDETLALIGLELERRGVDMFQLPSQWGRDPDELAQDIVTAIVDLMIKTPLEKHEDMSVDEPGSERDRAATGKRKGRCR